MHIEPEGERKRNLRRGEGFSPQRADEDTDEEAKWRLMSGGKQVSRLADSRLRAAGRLGMTGIGEDGGLRGVGRESAAPTELRVFGADTPRLRAGSTCGAPPAPSVWRWRNACRETIRRGADSAGLRRRLCGEKCDLQGSLRLPVCAWIWVLWAGDVRGHGLALGCGARWWIAA
jgi:hypothetical protein